VGEVREGESSDNNNNVFGDIHRQLSNSHHTYDDDSDIDGSVYDVDITNGDDDNNSLEEPLDYEAHQILIDVMQSMVDRQKAIISGIKGHILIKRVTESVKGNEHLRNTLRAPGPQPDRFRSHYLYEKARERWLGSISMAMHLLKQARKKQLQDFNTAFQHITEHLIPRGSEDVSFQEVYNTICEDIFGVDFEADKEESGNFSTMTATSNTTSQPQYVKPPTKAQKQRRKEAEQRRLQQGRDDRAEQLLLQPVVTKAKKKKKQKPKKRHDLPPQPVTREEALATSKRLRELYNDLPAGFRMREPENVDLPPHLQQLLGEAERAAQTLPIRMADGTPYTKKKMITAYESRLLHYCTGHASTAVLKSAIENGFIRTHLTGADIEESDKMLGACPSCILAKNRKNSYHPTVRPMMHDIGGRLHIDIKEVTELVATRTRNKHGQLTMEYHKRLAYMVISVDEVTGYLHIVASQNKYGSTIEKAILKTLIFYHAHGHQVREVHMDSEAVLRFAAQNITAKYPEVTFRAIPPHQHAQQIERYIHTLADGVAATAHSAEMRVLPYFSVHLWKQQAYIHNYLPNSKTDPATPAYYVLNKRFTTGEGAALYPVGKAVIIRNPEERNHLKGEFAIVLMTDTEGDNTHIVYGVTSGEYKRVGDRDITPVDVNCPHFCWMRNHQLMTIPNMPPHPTTTDKTRKFSFQNISALAEVVKPNTKGNVYSIPLPDDTEDEDDSYEDYIPEENTYQWTTPHKPDAFTRDGGDPNREQELSSAREGGQRKRARYNNNDTGAQRVRPGFQGERHYPLNSVARSGEHVYELIDGVEDEERNHDLYDYELTAQQGTEGEQGQEGASTNRHASAKKKTSRSKYQRARTPSPLREQPAYLHPLEDGYTILPQYRSETVPPSPYSDTPPHTSPPRIATPHTRPSTSKKAKIQHTHTTAVNLPTPTAEPPPPIQRSLTLKEKLHEKIADMADTRKSGRSRQPTKKVMEMRETTNYKCNNISVQKALQGEHAHAAREAIINEINNLMTNQCGHFKKFTDVPLEKLRSNALNSFMFIKIKYTPDGLYEKTKARIVVNGAQQQQHLYDIIAASTVALSSVFQLLNIASWKRTMLCSFDITGAFLHTHVEEGVEIYVIIDKQVAEIWITLDPTLRDFLNPNGNGTLLMQLDRYLYGLKQSPAKFQKLLASVLISLGYKQLESDECMYVKHRNEGFSILSVHVDDILQACTDRVLYDELNEGLKHKFGGITAHEKATSYLGMTIQRNDEGDVIGVSQKGSILALAKQHPRAENDRMRYNAPVSEMMVQRTEESDLPLLNDKDRLKLLSVTMSLMYIARLTRPDILFAVTHLACRSHKATSEDQAAAMHVVRYLEKTVDLQTIIKCDGMAIRIYADASLSTHRDGRGHSGFTVHLGDSESYLHSRSNKQKLTALSSAEAELYSLTDAVKFGLWARGLIEELQICALPQITIEQDNKATILMALGEASNKNTKHFIRRVCFVCQQVMLAAIVVPYCPTELMLADLFTKALIGILFLRFRYFVMGLQHAAALGASNHEYFPEGDTEAIAARQKRSEGNPAPSVTDSQEE